MGKAQSKRSVDITTDPKKDGVVEEGTGELKKIEDVDQIKPQENGDTHHNENEEKTAEPTGETENEKDSSTEKEQKPNLSTDGAGGDNAVVAVPTTDNVTAENGDETLNESKGDALAETSTAETPDSSKKPKKEKLKKKWSFRGISFGKKDKQKPVKKEEPNTSAANGECEKVPEETHEEPTTEKTEETTAADIVKPDSSNAIEENTPIAAANITEAPKEETIVDVKKPEENSTEVIPISEVLPVSNGINVIEQSSSKIEEGVETARIAIDKIEEKIEEVIAGVAAVEINSSHHEEIAIPTSTAVATTPVTTNGDKHTEDDENSVVQKTNGEGLADVAAPKQNGSSESPKIEENGVGENHAETSATESLNGVEHKTIEEIKAENQQIEKNSSIDVTQEKAIVAE